ncbi:MAG: dGTP triphosphohydrolase [Candidatus Adiutrix sp.]
MAKNLDEFAKARLDENKRDAQDHRNNDQRSYSRLIHSAAFRRLQNKTQIFGLGENDFYRTRLTHTLEVMQIAGGIVAHMKSRQKTVVGWEFLPQDELIKSVCLAHDLGHPPFGHSGEVALNYAMRVMAKSYESDEDIKAKYGFEANGQTLRIIARLEKYKKDYGLNPSRRLVLGVLKYPAPFSLTVNEGAYQRCRPTPLIGGWPPMT